jgi:hypothetical protein
MLLTVYALPFFPVLTPDLAPPFRLSKRSEFFLIVVVVILEFVMVRLCYSMVTLDICS